MADSIISSALETELIAVAPDGFGLFEAEWRTLEDRARMPSPYVGFDWLSIWLRVYLPARLLVARLLDASGVTIALGLLEAGAGGRWSFAGGGVTSHRGLLHAAGDGFRAWQALGRELSRSGGSWTLLDGYGVEIEAEALPRARLEPVPFLVMDLPGSFDEYMAGRTSKRRWALRQKLRALEEEGGIVRAAGDPRASLGEFVRLHQARARAKGERHPQIDERLASMLAALLDAETVQLALDEVVLGERTLGVSVHLRYGECVYSYNIGVDTDAGRLSPGMVLNLAALHDAIERGYGRFDFGSGYYKYKQELGGAPVDRYRVTAGSPSLRGSVAAAALEASARARRALRPLWRTIRRR